MAASQTQIFDSGIAVWHRKEFALRREEGGKETKEKRNNREERNRRTQNAKDWCTNGGMAQAIVGHSWGRGRRAQNKRREKNAASTAMTAQHKHSTAQHSPSAENQRQRESHRTAQQRQSRAKQGRAKRPGARRARGGPPGDRAAVWWPGVPGPLHKISKNP